MTDLAALYPQHVRERLETSAAALEESGFDRMLLHAGQPHTYFADDNDAPFHPTPHFAHWSPVEGPGHLLEVVPGKKARLLRVTPLDFWYEPPAPAPAFVREAFDVEDVPTAEAAWKAVANGAARTAYVGGAGDEARDHGFAPEAINPKTLVARLDWERQYKSAYEVEALARATAKAARGFLAAEAAFRAGASELSIHHAYLTAVGAVEQALPYQTIIGLDERAATLHYHGKRGDEAAPGAVLLIDAGAMESGYGCDITRTYVTAKADPLFVTLLEGVKTLQKELADGARPGLPYLELHVRAHRLVAGLLASSGISRVCDEETFDRGLTRPFLPHGLGHFLGIQVHDVAGKQTAREGGLTPPPPEYPFLRTTRTIEERQVFTIEPGLYFIPMLLAPLRENGGRDAIDWTLVDRLTPFGGIRVEDDVYVGPSANRNLTREALPE